MLNKLNSQQRAAVESPKGIIRVVAGAGSGKTSCLTAKIAYEIQKGMAPEKILALTFTKKAGNELRTRLKQVIGDKADRLFAGTFHSFAHQNLVKAMTYSLVTDNDILDILKTLVEDKFNGNIAYQTGDLLGIISSHRNLQKEYADPNLKRLEMEYKAFKLKNGLKDYDDLLEDFLLLLRKNLFKFNHELVLADEGQDNSVLQSQITKELIKTHRNLFLVGDAAQSIYGWRGASLESFVSWDKEGCKDFPLAINYRSTGEVLKVANKILKSLPDGPKVELIPIRNEPNAPKAKLVKVANGLDEVNYIAKKILELKQQGHDFSSMAVVYRAHFISQTLQLKLAELGIPCTVWSGQNLLTANHIQDVVCFLRAYTNPRDVVAWSRIFRLLPRVGKVSAHKFAETTVSKGLNSVVNSTLLPVQMIFRAHNPQMFLNEVQNFYLPIVRESHPDTTKDQAVIKFLDFARSHPDLKKFVTDIIFSESTEKETTGVILTTIHQSKGLEWENVFVMGIYDGVFPSFRNEDQDEELRLYYVAVTRAKTNLFCTFPELTSKNQPAKHKFFDILVK